MAGAQDGREQVFQHPAAAGADLHRHRHARPQRHRRAVDLHLGPVQRHPRSVDQLGAGRCVAAERVLGDVADRAGDCSRGWLERGCAGTRDVSQRVHEGAAALLPE